MITMTNQRIVYSGVDGKAIVVIPTGELSLEDTIAKDVPEDVYYEIIDAEAIPPDRTFREAWIVGDNCIDHNIAKCKIIGHEMRRAARSKEFAPLDEIIAKQIPGVDLAAAENNRVLIRQKYADMQVNIDAATSPEDIKLALNGDLYI